MELPPHLANAIEDLSLSPLPLAELIPHVLSLLPPLNNSDVPTLAASVGYTFLASPNTHDYDVESANFLCVQLLTHRLKQSHDTPSAVTGPTSEAPVTVGTSPDDTELESYLEMATADFHGRKSMLLSRFAVTAKAFSWSDTLSTETTATPFLKMIADMQADLAKPSPRLTLATLHDVVTHDVIAGFSAPHRSTTTSRLKSTILTNTVPDRGGRADEKRSMMPEWKEREEDGGGKGYQGNKGKGKQQGGGKQGEKAALSGKEQQQQQKAAKAAKKEEQRQKQKEQREKKGEKKEREGGQGKNKGGGQQQQQQQQQKKKSQEKAPANTGDGSGRPSKPTPAESNNDGSDRPGAGKRQRKDSAGSQPDPRKQDRK